MMSFLCLGGLNRGGAAMPAFLRTPTVIQPHLDMKPFLQFPMETPPPPAPPPLPPPHSLALFHNFSTVRAQRETGTTLNDTKSLPQCGLITGRIKILCGKVIALKRTHSCYWYCLHNTFYGQCFCIATRVCLLICEMAASHHISVYMLLHRSGRQSTIC